MRDPFPYLTLGATLLLLLLTAPVPAAIAIGALALIALARPPRRRETLILAAGLLLTAALLGGGAAMARFAGTPAWSRSGRGQARRPARPARGARRTGARGGRRSLRHLASGRRVRPPERAGRQRRRRLELPAVRSGRRGGGVVGRRPAARRRSAGAPARRRPTSSRATPPTTLYALRAAQDGANAWWIAAGRSFPRDRLPFSPGPLLERRAYRWWIERDAAADSARGRRRRLAIGRRSERAPVAASRCGSRASPRPTSLAARAGWRRWFSASRC